MYTITSNEADRISKNTVQTVESEETKFQPRYITPKIVKIPGKDQKIERELKSYETEAWKKYIASLKPDLEPREKAMKIEETERKVTEPIVIISNLTDDN